MQIYIIIYRLNKSIHILSPSNSKSNVYPHRAHQSERYMYFTKNSMKEDSFCSQNCACQ